MSAMERALALFRAGVPVRDIGPLVGITGEPLRELLPQSDTVPLNTVPRT